MPPTSLDLTLPYLWGVLTHSFARGASSGRMISHLSPACYPAWSTLWMLCPHDFTFVSHLSPLVSHLSPSMLGMLCPHDFTFVSHGSPLVSQYARDAWFVSACSLLAWFTFVFHLSPFLSHLSLASLWMLCPRDLHDLSPLDSQSSPMTVHVSPSTLWTHDSTCVSHLSPLVLCSHDSTFVSHLSPLLSHLSLASLWMLCPRDFTCVSHLSPLVLHLFSSALWMLCPVIGLLASYSFLDSVSQQVKSIFPQTGLPVSGSYSLTAVHAPAAWFGVWCFGPHDFPLVSYYTLHSLPAWFQAWLPLGSTCLPTHYGCSECLGPHAYALVSQFLFPTLCVLWSAWFPACLQLVSYYTLHSLPAWFQAWLPLVSTCLPTHYGCSECLGPHDYALVSQFLFPTLCVLWSAWFRTCLPLVFQMSPTTMWIMPTWFQAYLQFGIVSHSLWILCPRNFRVVSICLPLQHTLDDVSAFPRDFTLVSTCLHFSPNTLGILLAPWSAWSRTCLPLLSHLSSPTTF